MIENMESLKNLTDQDRYIVTVSVWKDQQISTDCRVHNFPTSDLPIARNDITTLIHETYLKTPTAENVTSETDQQKAVNEKVKDLLTDK